MNIEELRESTLNIINNGFYGKGRGKSEELLDAELLDVSDSGIVVKFNISDWQRTPMGDLQSGIIMNILDYSAALACVPRFGITKNINIDINFLDRVGPDINSVSVKVTIEKQGRTIISVTCRMLRDDGVTAAISAANIMEHRSRYELTHKSQYELDHENQEQLEHEKQLELEHRKTYQLPYSSEE